MEASVGRGVMGLMRGFAEALRVEANRLQQRGDDEAAGYFDIASDVFEEWLAEGFQTAYAEREAALTQRRR